MTLNTNFIEWACSPSGCDGGNPDAEIWLCGIEWGGGDEKYYSTDLPAEIKNGAYIPSKKYEWDKTLSYTYGRSVAKLYTAIIGKKVENYQSVTKELNGSELFKLNLYPIAFQNTDDRLWKKHRIDEITGFEEKHLFKTWCFLHRFPAISDLTHKKKPKLIICTGISYLTDFFVCFAGASGVDATIKFGEIEANSTSNKHIKRKYYWAKLSTGTTIVVIPFFSGSHGLNSNYLIQEMGSRIQKIIT